jgi:hypothetical protein
MKIASVERAFRSVNEMVREGVFQAYAVGGAMGALFYEKDMEGLLKAHGLWTRWQGMKKEMGLP